MFWHLDAVRLGYVLLSHSAKWSRLKHEPFITSHNSVTLPRAPLSGPSVPCGVGWGCSCLQNPLEASRGLGLAERPHSSVSQWCCLRRLSFSSGLDLLPSSVETRTQERRLKVARPGKPKTGKVSNQKLILIWGKGQQHAHWRQRAAIGGHL